MNFKNPFEITQIAGASFLLCILFNILYVSIMKRIKAARGRKWDYLRTDFNKSLASLIADEIYFSAGKFSSNVQLQLTELKSKVDGSAKASQIMVDQIMTLRQNLSGRAPSILDEIYALLNLHHFSIEKLKSKRLKVQAQGIRELTNLSYEEAVSQVEGSRRTDNKEFMSNILTALVREGDKDLSFIDSYRGELTHWMQLKIYHHLLEVDVNYLPDFSHWFNSSNTSVALFAIKMSGVFRQRTAVPGLKALLHHPQKAIVEYSMAALDAMELSYRIPALEPSQH